MSFIYKLETVQLYQRFKSILISHPYGLSSVVPTFMMNDDVIQILVIKLLFSCKCSYDLSVVRGRYGTRVMKYKITLKNQSFNT